MFCKGFGGWFESTLKLILIIHQYLCNRTTYECFGCFSTKYKSPSSNDTFILRKGVENLYDMAYQQHCKIVVAKEVCLHYVTLPLLASNCVSMKKDDGF